MPQTLTRINPSNLPNSTDIGYSQISIVDPGPMAYVSGQVAISSDGRPVPQKLDEQTQVVVQNLKAALASINAKPEDIVIARIYIVDLNDDAMNLALPILLEFFEGALPSVTGIGVAALASPDFLIEVELTVRIPN